MDPALLMSVKGGHQIVLVYLGRVVQILQLFEGGYPVSSCDCGFAGSSSVKTLLKYSNVPLACEHAHLLDESALSHLPHLPFLG